MLENNRPLIWPVEGDESTNAKHFGGGDRARERASERAHIYIAFFVSLSVLYLLSVRPSVRPSCFRLRHSQKLLWTLHSRVDRSMNIQQILFSLNHFHSVSYLFATYLWDRPRRNRIRWIAFNDLPAARGRFFPLPLSLPSWWLSVGLSSFSRTLASSLARFLPLWAARSPPRSSCSCLPAPSLSKAGG